NAGRERLVLTFGEYKDKNGTLQNGADELSAALDAFAGKQVNLDIRIEEVTAKNGSKFFKGFVVVKEMVPRSQKEAKYTPKPSRAEEIKAKAEKIRQSIQST